jgi:large subunit ribosomal protein L26e
MKRSTTVTSSRRKNRKAHFTAPSSERRIIMSAPLNKSLKEKYNVRAMPVRKGDEVKIIVGSKKGTEGKIKTVYRKKYCIYIDKVTRDKATGTAVDIPIHPSNVEITKLHLDADRKKLLAKKSSKKSNDKVTKIQESEVKKDKMDTVN